MEIRTLIAGFGGQGVLSLGKMICIAADRKGLKATFFPSYGGEQRGGTCNCTVIISDEPIGSPIATQAEFAIIMNTPSYEKFKNSVVAGGKMMLNVSQVQAKTPCDDKIVPIEADLLADRAGNRIAANMVMLGAFTALSGFCSADDVEETLRYQLRKKPDLLQTNLESYHLGMECVR